MVNGVLTSCYASFAHDLAHIAMKPMEWYPEIIQEIFAEDDEISTFIRASKDIGKWILPYGQFLEN